MQNLPVEIKHYIGCQSIRGWKLAVCVSREFAAWSLSNEGKEKGEELFAEDFRFGYDFHHIWAKNGYIGRENSPAIVLNWNLPETTCVKIWAKNNIIGRKNNKAAIEIDLLLCCQIGDYCDADECPDEHDCMEFVTYRCTYKCFFSRGTCTDVKTKGFPMKNSARMERDLMTQLDARNIGRTFDVLENLFMSPSCLASLSNQKKEFRVKFPRAFSG